MKNILANKLNSLKHKFYKTIIKHIFVRIFYSSILICIVLWYLNIFSIKKFVIIQ